MSKTIKSVPPLSARPYELMCIICWLGAGDSIRLLRDKRLDAIFQAIRKDPRGPLRLCSYDGVKYAGKDHDSPHGVLFHMYQDEAIKGRFRTPRYLDRAQSGLGTLLGIAEFVTNAKNICWFDPKAAPAWRGCPLAAKGYYELGRKRIKDEIKNILGVKEGESTKDNLFHLDVVRCLGCCGLAPVLMIDEKVYSKVKKAEVADILSKYIKEE